MVRVLEKTKKKKSFFLRLAFVLILIYVSVVFLDRQVAVAQKRSEVNRLSLQLEEQKAANAELREMNENEDLAEYSEMIARTMLGYGYPGEKVYVDVSGN